MNRVRTITAAVLVASLAVGGAAFAQGPGNGGPGPRIGRRAMAAGLMLHRLNLTEAQQQQVRDIRERYREPMQQAAARVRDALRAQRTAVRAVPLDEGRIRAASFALAEAQTEAAIQQARQRAEIWLVLTSAQQEQLTKLEAERQARAAGRAPRSRGR